MFDPKPYLKNLNRDKDGRERKPERWYLQTAHRVLWFRTEHPNGLIDTEIVQLDPVPVFKATITTGDGVRLATGYGSAQPKAGSVYAGREVEKAETAAIGRALGLAGYGTQFDGDDDSDNLADSPVERKPAPVATPQTVTEFVAEKKPDAAPVNDDKRKAAWTKFTAYWFKEEQMTAALLCDVLGVDDLLHYTGSFDDANAAVMNWLAMADDPPVVQS